MKLQCNSVDITSIRSRTILDLLVISFKIFLKFESPLAAIVLHLEQYCYTHRIPMLSIF